MGVLEKLKTEDNFIYRLKADHPKKMFYAVGTLCEGMNKISVEQVKVALQNHQYKIDIPPEIRTKAKAALDNMLTVSQV